MTAFDRLADDIHVVCRSVIGSEAGVFRHTAAELREHEHRNIVGAPDALHVLHEARDRIRNIGEQPLMQIRLLYVSVEGIVTIRGVVEPRRHAGRDQRGDFRKLHRHDAVVDRCLVAGPGVAHQLRGLARTLRHLQQELLRSAGVGIHVRRTVEQRPLLVKPFAPELLGIVEHHGHMLAGAHRQRLHFVDIDDEVGGRSRVDRIGNPANPTVLFTAVRRAGVPIRHRCEMREGRLRVAATVHDGHLAVLVQPLESRHSRVEAVAFIDLAQFLGPDPDFRPMPVIGVVRVRHERVQSVVAARQLEHDQDAV